MTHFLLRITGFVFASLTLASLMVACGSSNGVARGSIQACLEDAGAEVGRSPADLDFLAAAEAAQEVSKPSFAYDKRADVVVRMWTGSFNEGKQPSWILWYGEPFGQDHSPWQIASQHPNDTFVLYVNQASSRIMQHAQSCITFDDEREQHETRLPPINSSAR